MALDLEKLKEDVQRIFDTPENAYSDVETKVSHWGGKEDVMVTVSRMYEHLPLTFDVLMKLSELFGTKEYTVNQWSSRGCETCNYGSEYAHEFTFKAYNLYSRYGK